MNLNMHLARWTGAALLAGLASGAQATVLDVDDAAVNGPPCPAGICTVTGPATWDDSTDGDSDLDVTLGGGKSITMDDNEGPNATFVFSYTGDAGGLDEDWFENAVLWLSLDGSDIGGYTSILVAGSLADLGSQMFSVDYDIDTTVDDDSLTFNDFHLDDIDFSPIVGIPGTPEVCVPNPFGPGVICTPATDPVAASVTWVETSFYPAEANVTAGVPEPTTVLILGMGLAGLAGLRRRS